MPRGFDVAQVCIFGHVVNPRTEARPGASQAFCSICGESTITECQTCGWPIRGPHKNVFGPFREPSYCGGCGTPFPWTLSRLTAAHALVKDLAGLTEEERQLLDESIDELARETPATDRAVIRFKRLMAKAKGPAVALLQQMMIQLASSYIAGQLGLT